MINNADFYVRVIDCFVIPIGVLSLIVFSSMQIYMLWKYKTLNSLIFWDNPKTKEYKVIKFSFLGFLFSILSGIVLSILSNL